MTLVPKYPILQPLDPRALPSERVAAVVRQLLAHGYATWQLQGRSMHPTLPEGTAVTVAPLTAPLRVGQLVAFVNGGDIVIHRVVARHKERWITAGDNRLTPDPLLDSERIIGKVIRAEYAAKVLYPRQNGGLIAFLAIARYHARRVKRWWHRRSRHLL